jgi:hypothetical protein
MFLLYGVAVIVLGSFFLAYTCFESELSPIGPFGLIYTCGSAFHILCGPSLSGGPTSSLEFTCY